MHFFRERFSVCVCVSFPFDFEVGMWDLIILVPFHCPSFNFPYSFCTRISDSSLINFERLFVLSYRCSNEERSYSYLSSESTLITDLS